MTDVTSKFYPYEKIYKGYSDLSESLLIPKKIANYLLDLPDGYYTPIDDNAYPRTRLWKYLYYDGDQPLENPLPTAKQKKSVLFDPDEPTKPSDPVKGFRLIPEIFIKPAQTDAQTRIYFYMGSSVPDNDFRIQMSVVFRIWTHYTEENNTRMSTSYSRVSAIEQALFESLHGVNMAGVGAFYFNRAKHSSCRSTPITDGNTNVGRELVMGIEVASNAENFADCNK